MADQISQIDIQVKPRTARYSSLVFRFGQIVQTAFGPGQIVGVQSKHGEPKRFLVSHATTDYSGLRSVDEVKVIRAYLPQNLKRLPELCSG
jgi:hypothetical protein